MEGGQSRFSPFSFLCFLLLRCFFLLFLCDDFLCLLLLLLLLLLFLCLCLRFFDRVLLPLSDGDAEASDDASSLSLLAVLDARFLIRVVVPSPTAARRRMSSSSSSSSSATNE